VKEDEGGPRGERRRDWEGPAEEERYIMLDEDREVNASVVSSSSSSAGVMREVKAGKVCIGAISSLSRPLAASATIRFKPSFLMCMATCFLSLAAVSDSF